MKDQLLRTLINSSVGSTSRLESTTEENAEILECLR